MDSQTIGHLHLSPSNRKPLLKSQPSASSQPSSIPTGKKHVHPSTPSIPSAPASASSDLDASITFIGNATTLLEWNGIRLLTDPNFLHAGDHVHLGPGVTAKRLHDPHVDLDQLPALDAILLSHYHEDHFDKLVEDSLNRDFDIISTPHAKHNLAGKEEPFTAVHDLDFFQSLVLHVGGGQKSRDREPVVKVTAMPGKHVPPGFLEKANELLGAVPPTNGWMVEMGYVPTGAQEGAVDTGYRIYISGDTLMVDELKEIPKRLKDERIDLMLVHLGGTTIPGPAIPLLMVTMDAKQGLQLMRLVNPDVTIPIHFDDYDVFLSPLGDFKDEVAKSEFEKRVVYLDRGEQYGFKVRE
ncbi:Metallo-hydrolase/oxidoreductase [Coniochaeta ligniaria NRRL 30616]|uniref:Metallo-hydrolase/oxidoreductase n=1 Tax=Coniochaeta ligniaria NRRL 30616 TaxID=1408157 RepID=A0A1J7IX62_9PEZI|nr:Metallo-hydrolase/oxidoreductase [Coniochaeta ligniaria NRRL 30616]